jgi:hypothetical protein
MLSSEDLRNINERFLQFIWKHRLFSKNMQTTDGKPVEIVRPGGHNTDAGADFYNAQIKIDGTLWAGDVEIHLRSSDWFRHQHHINKAYDSVILQVVLEDDAEIFRTTGTQVPTAIIDFDPKYWHNYVSLQKAVELNPIACASWISKVDPFIMEHWLAALLIERMEQKSAHLVATYIQHKENWEETFYQLMARSFGANLNGDPFEMMAKSLPMNILAKHKDNLFQLEALIFGQAGLLADEQADDEYYTKLRREYFFLQHKYELVPIEGHLWKFLRLRPSNFPTVRLAQFAALIHISSGLFSKVMEAPDIKSVQKYFEVEVSEYWKDHYVFHKKSPKESKTFGIMSFYNILINTIIPFQFVYGRFRDDEKKVQQSLVWLEQIPTEINSVIDDWRAVGIKSQNAANSQALLQLKKHYCDLQRCIECSIGCRIIKE